MAQGDIRGNCGGAAGAGDALDDGKFASADVPGIAGSRVDTLYAGKGRSIGSDFGDKAVQCG